MSISQFVKCCHNWLNLGFSAKLRILQVTARKMEPQRVIMKPPTWPPNHPPTDSPSFSWTSWYTRELKFCKKPYFTKIRFSKVSETFVQVIFVKLKFVLVLKVYILGNQIFMYMLFSPVKIGPENLFGRKYLVWQKNIGLKNNLDPNFVDKNYFWIQDSVQPKIFWT